MLRVIIVLIAIAQFCSFLNHRDITTAHEGRVAATAREMLASGDFLIPHLNGQVRLQKPPLPYWLTAAAWKIAGTNDAWLARLPAALCGAIATLLVAGIARQTLGRRTGVVAALVWVSTWFIVDEFRKAMADPYLAFFTLLSVWAWLRGDRARSGGLIMLAYVAAGLGAMAKGPLILLHLVLALVPYHVVRGRPPRKRVAHVAGVVVFLAISLPWPVFVSRQMPGALTRWRSELAAERATSGEKSSSPLHYLVALPLTAAPWTAFAAVGCLTTLIRRRPRDRRVHWPLAWLALTVLVFSFVPMKKNAYLLPAMPAQTLVITAAVLEAIRLRRQDAANRSGDRLLIGAHAAAAIVAFCLTLYVVLDLPSLDMERPGPLLAACAAGLFLIIGSRSMSDRLLSLRTFALTAVGFALMVHGVVAWIVPETDNKRSEAAFATAVNAKLGGQPLYVIGPGLREDLLFYLGRTVPVLPSLSALPAGYTGFAIVTADEHDAVVLADVADEISVSAERPEWDRVYLMQFPKNPNPPMRER